MSERATVTIEFDHDDSFDALLNVVGAIAKHRDTFRRVTRAWVPGVEIESCMVFKGVTPKRFVRTDQYIYSPED